MPTPDEILRQEDEEWAELTEIRPNDGLILSLLKLIFGRSCWRCLYRGFVSIGLWSCRCRHSSYQTESEARKPIWIITDVYMLTWTVFLLFACSVTFHFQSSTFIVWFACAVSVFRILEIFSVVVELHTSKGYLTSAPGRAVANTFWHYIELILAFAVLYLAAGVFSCDNYQLGFEGPEDAIYFSLVTITTLGYGEYHPTEWPGKLLVSLQVLLGLVLLVFVVQRAIASTLSDSRFAGKSKSRKDTP
jgi:hypothetical protein